MVSVLISPRWGGTDGDDWYPWLVDELSSWPQTHAEVVPLAPSADEPSIEESRRALLAAVGRVPDPVVLVGHSVGAQVVLRSLPSLSADLVRGVVAVAGWFEVDEPWPAIQPWLDTPVPDVDPGLPITVLLSDDDPFTADHERTRRDWERLGADVSVLADAGHLNDSPQRPVLDAVAPLLTPDRLDHPRA